MTLDHIYKLYATNPVRKARDMKSTHTKLIETTAVMTRQQYIRLNWVFIYICS